MSRDRRTESGSGFSSSTFGSAFYTLHPVFSGVLGILIGGVGLWIFSIGVQDVADSAASSSWPKIQGHIDRSVIETHSGKNGATYSPDITYSYYVKGTEYVGRDIALGHGWSNAQALKLVDQFSTGSTANVSYSSDHPQRALLLTGLRASTFCYAFGGLAVIGFGLAFLFSALSARDTTEGPNGTVTFLPGSLADRFSTFVLLVTIGSMLAAFVVSFF